MYHSGSLALLDPSVLSGLATSDLVVLWRKSHAALLPKRTVMAKLAIVMVRAALLQELETRMPHAMDDWVVSGAVDPSGPGAFLFQGER